MTLVCCRENDDGGDMCEILKIRKSLQALVGGCLLLLTLPCEADLPLAVEGLLTEKGRLRLDVGVSYANSDKQKISTGEYLAVQTGPTNFVYLPTRVGEGTVNSDVGVGTLGLKYGVHDGLEIYGRTSWFIASSRSSELNGSFQTSDKGMSDLWIGASYRFTGELVASAETALLEKHNGNSSSLKSVLLGLTTYKSIDPVVLSAAGAYKFSISRDEAAATYKAGSYLMLNPSLGFAVNEKVSLTSGLQWTLRFPDQINGVNQSVRHTRTDLVMGFAYGFDRGSILNFYLKSNVSGRNGADLRAVWMYTFP
ncbi:hypothetical protein ABIC71_004659 [Herbaspirillum seropedicae]|uniref:hypothetical protein n=1 Tax=Herbaspirillum seropedicae TaxID=964 RepID=UPI0033974A95